MKTTIRKVMAAAMGMALMGFVISCASTGAQSKGSAAGGQKSGFLHEYYAKL
jgi:hypothetical protein